MEVTNFNAHAYLLLGENAEALKKAAFEICAKNIRTGGNIERHPDVRVLPGADGKYNKAVMEAFFGTLYLAPVSADFVYYILENAHDISERWQNTLLKTLEEPPPSVRLILLAGNKSRILPTVLSRCTCIEIGGGETELDRKVLDAVTNTLLSLKSSAQLAMHIHALSQLDLKTVLVCTAAAARALMREGSLEAKVFLDTADAVSRAELRRAQNGNATSIVEELLMCVLESKSKERI